MRAITAAPSCGSSPSRTAARRGRSTPASQQATSEFILCMDGDSALHPATLRRAIRHFEDPAIGAVAGTVKVVNRTNLLSSLQALEYIEGLNMVRAAQGFFRLVNIIPGPIGIFRKSALEKRRRLRPRHLRRGLRPHAEAAARGLADPVRAGLDRVHRSAREAARPAEAAISLDARNPAGDLEAQAPSVRSARRHRGHAHALVHDLRRHHVARDERASGT